jgi:hypothetical protein
VRAEQALTLTGFDPALAARCLLPAAAAGVDRARALLPLLLGTG